MNRLIQFFKRLWRKWFGGGESAKPRVVVDGDRFSLGGKRFFPVADTAWQLIPKLSDEDIQWYLRKRQEQGFNTVKFGLEGEFFKGTIKKPNEMRWAKLLRILGWLDELNMWAELGVNPIQSYSPKVILSENEWREYGRLVGERLKDQRRIWAYIVSGADDKISLDRLKVIEAGLRESDPARIIGYHPPHQAQITADFCYAQTGHRDLSQSMTLKLQKAASKSRPWYDGEPCYEHLVAYGTNHTINSADVRRIAAAGLDRKAGLSYGSIRIALFQDGWKAAMNATGAAEVVRISKGLK